MGQHDQQERRDFLISYTGHDITWAEWIGTQLEQEGYSIFLRAWDVRPGHNLIVSLDQALRTCTRCLLVLSNAYLQDGLTQAQWAAVFRQDPANEHRTLLPVKVEDCHPTGFLATHNPIDLYGLEETEATERLLAFLVAERFPPSQQIAEEAPRQRFYPGSPVTWNLPYHRNPYFTGQEEHLSELRKLLWENQSASVTQTEAISGLGGIGKTQLAVEYAYRYRADYTHIFWVRADSQETIIDSYSEIADVLQLPERVEQDQSFMVAALQRWFQQHRRYLLILDNADDLAVVQPFLPTACPGHVVLTTRTQHLGKFARRLELDTLSLDVGAVLLLRRAGLIGRHAFLEGGAAADQALALTLTAELGGLPLALDQAGAYIEVTRCSLAAYQQEYQIQRAKLLALRDGPAVLPGTLKDDHPEPVATTWSLSFAKVEQASPIAAELLRFCAFLAPDAIPEELLTEALKKMRLKTRSGLWHDSIASQIREQIAKANTLLRIEANLLPKEVQIDEEVALLRAYSLIRRNTTEKTLSVHRLVQVVVCESLPAETRWRWMLDVASAVDAVFPDVTFTSWSTCERLLPHALLCATWIGQALTASPLTVALLNQIGHYLGERGRYREAEPLLKRALAICEQQFSASDLRTATGLYNLGELYHAQGDYWLTQRKYLQALGKYVEAEPLLKRALAIWEQDNNPKTEMGLNGLATIYSMQRRYRKAEPLFVRALAISEQQLGAEHPNTAGCLNGLAALYYVQGKYGKAEPLFVRALAISEQQLGAEHLDTASCLWNLAKLYCRDQRKYEQAELLYIRALAIYEQQLGSEHPITQTARADYTSSLRKAKMRKMRWSK